MRTHARSPVQRHDISVSPSAVGLAIGVLASCAQQGDFGRPKAGAWNSLIDATGTLAAGERHAPASASPLTDDEQDLRNRSWRFLMPAMTRDAFLDILANLTRARVLPPSWRPDDPRATTPPFARETPSLRSHAIAACRTTPWRMPV